MTAALREPVAVAVLDRERAARRRLAIPADAKRVLVLCESSHWDPGWLLSARDYFRLRVARILTWALDELEAEPTRVYNIESTFFLRMFWDQRPDERPRLYRLLVERRLRLAGIAVTTPDTVVTHGEALLRDHLAGERWLAAIGATYSPRTAYLPDSFGHSPLLPTLLSALGIGAVAFARVDGMALAGSDLGPPARGPRPGSTAARLLDELRSLDVVWRDPAGAEVLAHWHARGYGHGDLLAHRGMTRWMGAPLAVPSRSARAVARRIHAIATTIAASSRTPYLLCPIGFDFVAPVHRLGALIDRYNREVYPTTGLHVVSAGLDDYFDLLDGHRAALPQVTLDPNPCFMGFPASRPELKAAYHRVVARLLAADAAAAAGARDAAPVRALWERAVMANHHDFVTGTSRTAVVRREQAPLLANIEHELGAVPASRPLTRCGTAPRWRVLPDGVVVVETSSLEVTIDPRAGGTLYCVDRRTGDVWLDHGSVAVRSYLDDGGLWRLGHEVWGGRLRRRADTSERPARVAVAPIDGALRVTIDGRAGAAVRLEITIDDAAPELAVAITAPKRRRRTWTIATRGALVDARLATAVPGGVVARPIAGPIAPTFWGVDGLAHVVDAREAGTALLSTLPLAVAADEHGGLEWIVGRHATGERALGIIPLPGFPVRGGDRARHRVEVVLRRVVRGHELARLVARVAALRARAAGAALPADAAGILLDRPDVVIAAVAPAWRGNGVIVRLATPARGIAAAPPRSVRLRWPCDLEAATLCDALERDRAPLQVAGRTVVVPLDAAIVSVRLHPVRGEDA